MKTRMLFSLSTAILSAVLPLKVAQAVPQTFISSTGSGTACTRANPCSDALFAVLATDPGGTIACLDSGPFSGVGPGSPINKSVTIDCFGARFFTIAVSGSGIVVTLRNLSINAGAHAVGVDFINGAALFVENCAIENFTSAPGFGIRFRPSTSGAQLLVTDSTIRNSGNAGTGGAIIVQPQSGGTAQVLLNRTTVAKNVFGIVADSTLGAGGINMTISDSVADGNSQDGIIAIGGSPIGVLVTNSKSVNNNIGIRSIGANVTVRVDGSTITGNGTGLSFSGGGALLSFGTNKVQGNAANGAFSGSLALQ